MSDKNLARRTEVQVFFGGVDITRPLQKNLLSFTYKDNEEDETDMIEIQLEDRDGVWLTHWLDDSGEEPNQPVDVPENVYKVTAQSGLNVRSGPGADYARLGSLSYGSEVEVESITNGWAKISYGGVEAYVSASYIAESDDEDPVMTEQATLGLKIQASIIRRNWRSDGADKMLDCGEFELDSVDASGPPSVVTIKGTSLPFNSQMRQVKKNKAWESYSLSKIANEMASLNGMACMYESPHDPYYDRVEQIAMSDIEFLSQLCHEAGISLKATNNMIVLFDQSEYEAKPELLTITRGDGTYKSYKLRIGTANKQYTSCRVRYIDPQTGQLIQATAYTPNYKKSNKNNQHLDVKARVGSYAEAKARAEKELRLRNKRERTVVFTMKGNPDLVAGVTVRLEGWGMWSGKYIISNATHIIDTNGYITQIWLRRVLEGY